MIIWNQSIYSVTENINHVLTFLFFKNQSSFLRSTFIFFNMWIFYALIFVFLVCPIIVWIGITLAVFFPIILVLSPVFLAICCAFFWIFVVPPILIGGNLIALGYGVLYGWVLIQKTLLSRSFRGSIVSRLLCILFF